jgi:hypothetical protein
MNRPETLFVIKVDADGIKELIDIGFYKHQYTDLLEQAIKLDNVEVVS